MKFLVLIMAIVVTQGCHRLRVWDTADCTIAEQTGNHWFIDLPKYVILDKKENATYFYQKCMFGGSLQEADDCCRLHVGEKYIFIHACEDQWVYNGRYEKNIVESTNPPLELRDIHQSREDGPANR